MAKRKIARKIRLPKNQKLWRLQRELPRWLLAQNELPDAATVRKTKLRSVPVEMLPMIF